MSILKIEHLTKSYGSIVAVNDLSLTVEPGNIYGVLGPNGSGKTTTLGMILGIINKDHGSFEWFEGKYGNDYKARRQLGALLETPNFYPYLNAIKNLEIVAHIKRVKDPKIDEVLQLVNLFERRYYTFRTYSLGMKQRLAIAAALIGDPQVLIFDEPTNGLDPQGIAEVRETIREIARNGKTIIMASHILDEVEKVCTHVAIIKKGKLLATGTVGSIIKDQVQVEVNSSDNARLLPLLSGQEGISDLKMEEGKLVMSINDQINTAAINQLAFDNGILLHHLIAKKRSLEAEFLEITS